MPSQSKLKLDKRCLPGEKTGLLQYFHTNATPEERQEQLERENDRERERLLELQKAEHSASIAWTENSRKYEREHKRKY